jgi:hypothetical protein
MEYKIYYGSSPESLTNKVNEKIAEGWKPIGGVSAVEMHRQNRYAGSQHMDTIIKQEYSQAMVKGD